MSTHIVVNDLSKKLNRINDEKLQSTEIEKKVNELFDDFVSKVREHFELDYANEIINEGKDFKDAILSSLLEGYSCTFIKI